MNIELKLNQLLSMFFKMNSIADNMAYSLSAELKCPNASKIFHEQYAHIFLSDKFADKLSEDMLMLGYRPRRIEFSGDTQDYNDIVSLFSDNFDEILKLKDYIETTIDELDYEPSNKMVILILEDLLENLLSYIHQSRIWLQQAECYGENNHKFNLDFKDITFIK